jgi:DNA phosphorothioation-associated putative methyltransferase
MRKIERHRTAIVRSDLSRPVRLAFEAGLFGRDATFFDYGCGHGVDVKLIGARGYTSGGWDPYYFPENEIHPADIVNLGYVINVIECQQERREALLQAWALVRKVLIVAARVLPVERGKGDQPYGDGLITSRNTFQKYYGQQELKNYIDSVLCTNAIPIEPGVYFVFRNE